MQRALSRDAPHRSSPPHPRRGRTVSPPRKPAAHLRGAAARDRVEPRRAGGATDRGLPLPAGPLHVPRPPVERVVRPRAARHCRILEAPRPAGDDPRRRGRRGGVALPGHRHRAARRADAPLPGSRPPDDARAGAAGRPSPLRPPGRRHARRQGAGLLRDGPRRPAPARHPRPVRPDSLQPYRTGINPPQTPPRHAPPPACSCSSAGRCRPRRGAIPTANAAPAAREASDDQRHDRRRRDWRGHGPGERAAAKPVSSDDVRLHDLARRRELHA